jgi:hypothetical protein
MSKAVRTTVAAGTPAKAETMTTAESSNNFGHSRIKSNRRGMRNIIGGNMNRDTSNTRNVSGSRDTNNSSVAGNFAIQEASNAVFQNKLNLEKKN